jgi:hypothetical protein
MADEAVPLADLLLGLGFETPTTQARAREALVAAHLTTPTKQAISAEKRPRVEAVLRERFVVTCSSPGCSPPPDGRERILVHDRHRCWICGGSDNRRTMETAARLFEAAGIARLVVVGGSPSVHEELRQLAPPSWQMRVIDGTARRTSESARGDLRWADLVLLWGSSELDHKVSELYSGRTVVHVRRRGIAALLEEAIRFAENRRSVGKRS